MNRRLSIVNLAQKVLKVCFLMPYEAVSRKTNLFFGALFHLSVLLVSGPVTAVIVYQIAIGVDDVFALFECVITLIDYLSFVYFCLCINVQMSELQKIFYDIRVFLEFCDISLIENAEKDVQLCSILLVGYFCIGLIFNALAPLINLSECRKSRTSEFLQKYDPCCTIGRNLFPFDTRTIFRSTFVSVMKALSSFWLCMGFLGITIILIGLCIHILAQLDNLKKKLVKVFDQDVENPEEMEEKLNCCIRYHIEIINYTNRVFAVYSMMVLIYISITSMVFSLILFFISKINTLIDKLKYAVQLCGWLAMLFFTCYYAQRVTDESKSVADAVYASCWYKAPIKLQKSVCLMIKRSQRPLTLKAVSSCVISLVTFVRVIKTAYSIFAVIVTISD